jgi:hypothetical protein
MVTNPLLRRHLSALLRPAFLVEEPKSPAVEAWKALVHLRLALTTRDFRSDTGAMRKLADEIGLDHLMCGACWLGWCTHL